MTPEVLIIDDEMNIVRLLQANLRASGYRALTAPNGEEGLRLIKAERPGLVLLDLKLPGMSGWEVLSKVKASPELRDIPVLIITAAAREGDEDRAANMGAVGIVPKPFQFEELMARIRGILKGDAG